MLFPSCSILLFASETPGGSLTLKEVLILVLFLSLARGYEIMNDHLFYCGALSHTLYVKISQIINVNAVQFLA